jgi:hypothetical protein
VRTSKHLKHIHLNGDSAKLYQEWRSREELLSCLLPAIQESTLLRGLHVELPYRGGPSDLALENMLTHTQILRSLTLRIPLRYTDGAAVQSGLKKNTTLRELTLELPRGAATVSPILTTLRDHPLLRKPCLSGYVVDLTALETVLLSDTSKITEVDIHRLDRSLPMTVFQRALRALAQRPMLTKLGLCRCPLGCDEARLLQTILCSTPSGSCSNIHFSGERRIGGTCTSVVPQHVDQSARYIRE